MGSKIKASTVGEFFSQGRIFRIVLALGAVFMIIGILLGNPFEDYQAAATL